MRLVSIAVSVGLDRVFSYRWPAHFEEEARPGERVLVPFGPRVLVGVVRPVEVDPASVEELKLREVLERLDLGSPPTLGPDLVELCEWISRYSLAPVGEAYRLVLPGLLANADARRAALSEEGARVLVAAAQGPLLARNLPELSKSELRLMQALEQAPRKGLSVAKLTRLKPRVPGALGLLASLSERGLCRVHWEDATELSGRREMHYKRTALLRGRSVEEPKLKQIVGRSKQRRALLDHLESMGDQWTAAGELRGPFPRVTQLVPPLIDGGLVKAEARARALNPFDERAPEPSQAQAPTEDQARALGELHEAVAAGRYASFLLHGITGSGKTEVYLQAIAGALEGGGGAIILVPEIALTPQLADRFRARFGEKVAVLHSGLTPRQRLDAWDQIRKGERSIVIGPRSALFAPLAKVSVIVVDEEHDGSFKQEEGVRYSARDLALVRARSNDAVVILGSATPSLESYSLAKSGRHGYLRLLTRPTPRPLPKVELLALAVHRPDPETMMSATLRQAVLKCVEGGDQAILFLNRRGYTAAMT
jgi:primosomal protein N' (replication factor Y)